MSESNNTSRLSNELADLCVSESLSEEGLREIIQRRGLTKHNINHVDDYDFFSEACRNERLNEGIIRCLIEYFPDAISAVDDESGCLPLHQACNNRNVTLEIIKLLVDTAPHSVRSVDNYGDTPLHILCISRKWDAAAIQILEFIIEKYPEAVRHANSSGFLPIHRASVRSSPEFCRVLIEAYPGCERIADADGVLPLHNACSYNSLATVEYLYSIYKDAIHHTTTLGYPIHFTISSINIRADPMTAAEIVQFLLDCDPDQKLKQFQGMSLLHYACEREYGFYTIEAAVQTIQVLFDAHPEAIYDNGIALDRYDHQVQEFLNNQLFYARQAKDHRLMTTHDNNGRLPLHRAIQNNVRLGSIKLLVKGNPAALQSADNSGALPLHVACMHHDSVNVIQYLVELDQSTLDAMDRDGNTALHLLCHGARHDAIALLLDEFDAVSVSTRNADKKLPIDMLWESDSVKDRESKEYTESMYRLLRANPEMIMGIDMQQIQSSASTSSTLPCQVGKKRKLGL